MATYKVPLISLKSTVVTTGMHFVVRWQSGVKVLQATFTTKKGCTMEDMADQITSMCLAASSAAQVSTSGSIAIGPQPAESSPDQATELQYLIAQIKKNPEDNSSLSRIAVIIQQWFPNLQKLLNLKASLPEDKFQQIIGLAGHPLYEFSKYTGPAWQCCKCSAINLRNPTTTLCCSCATDVIDHISTGSVIFGGLPIPLFGVVKTDMKPLEQRKRKAPKSKQNATTPRKMEQKMDNAIHHVANAVSNENAEVAKLREEVKALKMSHNVAKVNAESKKSQRKLTSGIVHENPRVRAIARSQVTCENPTRYAGEYEDEETALSNPMDIYPLSFTPDAASSPYIPATDHLSFYFRNPCRWRVTQEWDETGAGWIYDMYCRPIRAAGTVTEQPVAAWVENFDLSDQSTEFLWFVYGLPNLTKGSPHGPMLLASGTKSDPAARGVPMMMDNSFTLQTDVVTSSHYGTVAMEMWKWADNRFQYLSEDTLTITGPSTFPKDFLIAALELGEYAFKVRVNGCEPGTNTDVHISHAQLASNGQRLTMGQHMAPGLLDNLNQCSLPIFQAGKWRYTNTAETLAQGGQIQQAHMTGDKHYRSFISAGGVAAAFKNLAQQDLEKGRSGCYGWLKQHDGCYNPRDYYKTHRVYGIIDSYHPLENDEPFVMIGMHFKDEASRSFTVKERCIIQYTTNDTWRSLALPVTSHNEWIESTSALKRVKQFYKNDDHIKAINRALGTVKEIGEVASSLGELFL